jgi:hypothetical protein
VAVPAQSNGEEPSSHSLRKPVLKNSTLDPTSPWDVLEVIVDVISLQEGRFVSLNALSLVSSSLVSKCHRYIFEEVELDEKAQLGSGFSYPRRNSSRILKPF